MVPIPRKTQPIDLIHPDVVYISKLKKVKDLEEKLRRIYYKSFPRSKINV